MTVGSRAGKQSNTSYSMHVHAFIASLYLTNMLKHAREQICKYKKYDLVISRLIIGVGIAPSGANCTHAAVVKAPDYRRYHNCV